MRLSLAFAGLVSAVLAAGAAHAADAQLSCKGQALIMPDAATTPLDVRLTIQGGLEAPSTVTYAWGRPEAPVPMDLRGLLGDTLSFHGMAPASGGDGMLVADAQLNRNTLALVLKVRRLGAASPEDVSFETTCQRG